MNNNQDRIVIFDTTLRDGEQCPGASMNIPQKLAVAMQLARLKVDVIEAGFPASSIGDFEAVNTIARSVKGPIIAGLARCTPTDIRAAAIALKPAGKRARIHVFLATSKIHREHKLKKAKSEIIRLATEGVKLARRYVRDVEFSPEDASRTEPEFLVEVCKAAISAGATTINIPDTVGRATPHQFGELISYLRSEVTEFANGKVIISVHCHNDLGLAVANSLEAAQRGARQIECTVNGIGERAGNAAFEEIVMAMKTRSDFFHGLACGVNTREIVKTSQLVSRMTGLAVQRNKAVVGLNAFAHSAGIHQDGILKHRSTYEIMDPADVGWGKTQLPLTKHSGRAAMVARLRHLGFKLSAQEVETIFVKFKAIGDKKKFVHDEDLVVLAESQTMNVPEVLSLEYFGVSTGTGTTPTATIRLRKHADRGIGVSSTGDGPVDAAFKAIDKITKMKGEVTEYVTRSISEGKDAMGEATVKVSFGKRTAVAGRGVSTDIFEASVLAYLNAVNRFLRNNH